MAEKQKSRQQSRAHKESQGKHGGGGKVRLNELQKVLLGGGMAHFTRKGQYRKAVDDTKAGRKRLEEARRSAEEQKAADHRKKLSVEASNLMHSGKSKR